MSYVRCPECSFVVRSKLEASGGYCPRCRIRRGHVVVMERLPVKLLHGPEAIRFRKQEG